MKTKRLALTKKQVALLRLTQPKSLSEGRFLNLMLAEGLCKYTVGLLEVEKSSIKKLKLINAVVGVSKEVIKENVRLMHFKKRWAAKIE